MKASLHNLGCKVNSYETEAMEQMLIKAGYEIVPFDDKNIADVYIINTCSVTNIADRKSRQMLHKAKKMNPQAVVVAAGCYVQAQGEASVMDGAVDIVIGNNRKKELIQILDAYWEDKSNTQALSDIAKEREYETLSIEEVCEHTRAYIKVQDGCNQFCSYCIIPYVRGRVRSRLPEDIIQEVKGLIKKGYKEFVLAGIHLSSYGIDWKNSESLDYQSAGRDSLLLLELIKQLDGLEGVSRIRLSSLEPRIVTDEFACAISQLDTICPHFHLSLQSGCDDTLKRMNRRYNTAQYEESCRILRKYFPDAAITTDVIVGFPQETEDEFNKTKEYLEHINFYEMHIFKYSRRKGTVADRMDGQIDEQVKTVRSEKLLALEQRMSKEYRKNALGTDKEVLFEELLDDAQCARLGLDNSTAWLAGHTGTYLRVLVPAYRDVADGLINELAVVHLDRLTDDGGNIIGSVTP